MQKQLNAQASAFLTLAKQPGPTRQFLITAAGIFFIAYAVAWFINPLWLAALVAATPLVIWFAARPSNAVLIMAATFPFTSIELTAGPLNVPIADAVAFIALIGWFFRYVHLRLAFNRRLHDYDAPLWPAALAFIAVALISAYGTVESAPSYYYVLRPMAFFYIAFVLLPVNTIHTHKLLERVLQTISGLGIAVAIYGLAGFVLAPATSFLSRRAVPVDIFGINPLASNHNLIANVLIIAIPVTLYLLVKNATRDQFVQKLQFLGLLAMVTTTALTFSRTGWLAVFLELVILLVFQYRHYLKDIARYTGVALAVALPLFAYMTFFSAQDSVQSSNFNRTLLNEIAISMFQESPWFGTGPGTFIDHVSRNRLYITEFGAPLDSHGFVQKVLGETGVFGFAAYVALLGGTLWIVLRRVRAGTLNATQYSEKQYLLVSLLAMAAGAAFFQLFQTSYYIGLLWLPIGIALAGSRIALHGEAGEDTL